MTRQVASMLFAILAGCAARPYPALGIEIEAETVRNVVVSERSLQDVVRVGSPVLARLSGGGIRIVVPVRNIDSEIIDVLAEIRLLGADEQPVAERRQAQAIRPGSTVELDWTTLTDGVADYVVRLSWDK